MRGGDGEAMQVVKRRALELQRENGFSAYKILAYSEGVESSTPLTQRVAETFAGDLLDVVALPHIISGLNAAVLQRGVENNTPGMGFSG